jgi:hypothetical protein
MRKLIVLCPAVMCILVVPFSGMAGDFDGSQPLLCATIKAVECGPEGECFYGMAESVNLPQFFKIDFKKKMISATKESVNKRSSGIKTKEHFDGKLILQGMGDELAWSMAISEQTGKMVITASGEQVGFIVFGACTPVTPD